MTAVDELLSLQKDACRIYQVDGYCNTCPFLKGEVCMIRAEISYLLRAGESR